MIDKSLTIRNELTSTRSSSNINQNPHDLTIEISENGNINVIIYAGASRSLTAINLQISYPEHIQYLQ